jgi:hypothetical protein
VPKIRKLSFSVFCGFFLIPLLPVISIAEFPDYPYWKIENGKVIVYKNEKALYEQLLPEVERDKYRTLGKCEISQDNPHPAFKITEQDIQNAKKIFENLIDFPVTTMKDKKTGQEKRHIANIATSAGNYVYNKYRAFYLNPDDPDEDLCILGKGCLLKCFYPNYLFVSEYKLLKDILNKKFPDKEYFRLLKTQKMEDHISHDRLFENYIKQMQTWRSSLHGQTIKQELRLELTGEQPIIIKSDEHDKAIKRFSIQIELFTRMLQNIQGKEDVAQFEFISDEDFKRIDTFQIPNLTVKLVTENENYYIFMAKIFRMMFFLNQTPIDKSRGSFMSANHILCEDAFERLRYPDINVKGFGQNAKANYGYINAIKKYLDDLGLPYFSIPILGGKQVTLFMPAVVGFLFTNGPLLSLKNRKLIYYPKLGKDGLPVEKYYQRWMYAGHRNFSKKRGQLEFSERNLEFLKSLSRKKEEMTRQGVFTYLYFLWLVR